MPATLLDAVEAYWTTAGLASSVGITYRDRAPVKFALPHVLLSLPRSSLARLFDGGDSQVDDYRLRLRVRATTAAEARRLADLVEAAYRGRSFAWDAGATSAAVRLGRASGAEKLQATGGEQLFFDEPEFQLLATGG